MRKADVSLVALAVAAGLWTIGQAAPAAAQTYGQNQQGSGLTPRGTPAASDLVPCQPSGGYTEGCTVGGIANLATGTVNTPCNGTGDDTAAIQAALNLGGVVQLPPGVCMISNLTVTVPGATLQGASMQDQALAGVGTILRAKSGASGSMVTVGVDSSTVWERGFTLRGFACDMTNLSDVSASVCIEEQSAWDG